MILSINAEKITRRALLLDNDEELDYKARRIATMIDRGVRPLLDALSYYADELEEEDPRSDEAMDLARRWMSV